MFFGEKEPRSLLKEGNRDADVNEVTFVLIKSGCVVCFIIAFKTDRCVE